MNCTCCVKLILASCITVLLDIIDKKVKSLKNKYSLFFSNGIDIPDPEPESENSMEGICPFLREFKDCQEVELVIEVPLQDREGNPRDERVEQLHRVNSVHD